MSFKSIVQSFPGYTELRQIYRRRWLKGKTVGEVFTYIHKHNIWGNHESVSGEGSTMEDTAALRVHLTDWMNRMQIKSVLDLPCGDFNWMKELDWTHIHYMGADIVPELITTNQAQYGNKQINFSCINLLEDKLPPADLLICKDCLVHFSETDVTAALQNILRSPVKYIGITHFPEITHNRTILTGEWRALNLNLKPFQLPAPLSYIQHSADGSKGLAIWTKEDLAATIP